MKYISQKKSDEVYLSVNLKFLKRIFFFFLGRVKQVTSKHNILIKKDAL